MQKIIELYEQYLTQQRNNQPDRAIYTLQQAVEGASQTDRPALLAALLLKLGHFLLESRGQIQDAVHAFTAGALRLQDDPKYQAEMRRAVSQLRDMRKGYRGSAESIPDIYLLDTDQDLLNAEKDPLLHVKHVFNAGACYLEMGQEEAAFGYFRQASELPALTQFPFLRAKVQTNLAELHRRRGELPQADELLEKAHKAFENSDRESETKEFYAILARLRQQQNRREEAIRHYESAAALYEQTDDVKGYGRTLTRLAQLYLEKEEWTAARKNFQRALEKSRQASDDNNQTFAHRGLALCYLAEEQPEKVIEHLEACIRGIHSVVATLRTEQGKLSRIDSMEGARNTLLDNYLALLTKQPDDGQRPRKILRKIDEFHGLVLDDILQGVIRANQETESLESDFGEIEFPDFQSTNMMVQQAVADYTPFPSRKVERPKRERVPPLPRLVYHLTEKNLIICVDHPGQSPVVVRQAIERDELRDQVKRLLRYLHVDQPARGFRGILSFDRPAGQPPVRQQLLRKFYQKLIQPVAAHLPAAGQLLVIEPHDALHLLPFAALADEDGQPLSNRYTLLLSPSQDALRRLRSYQPYHANLSTASVLVVGNPEMQKEVKVNGRTYGPFHPLDGAEKEAAFIQRSFSEAKVTHLKGSAASLSAIRKAAEKCHMIHLATHGLADEEEPMSSFLLVAGDKGYVTAREIRNWSLSADIVVLSACETALGRLANTEGVIGLARALLIAGARTVVVSLWPVHDEATALLMEYFYRELLNGKNTPEALRAAQMEIRKVPAYQSPVFWAGFVAMGCE